jgi:PHD/YefM family antitoxin component YafN of YafNO toxin-antitoxin module
MRYTATNNAEPGLVALLKAAQSEPVIIDRGEREVAVLLSARDYELLRSEANLDFQNLCDAVSDKAAAQGLTESKLTELLSHA